MMLVDRKQVQDASLLTVTRKKAYIMKIGRFYIKRVILQKD